MKDDLLYKIFHDHLNLQTQIQDEEPASDQDLLVRSVTATYFSHLKNHGHIPFDMVRVVLEDLEQEVIDMYRKKTYGHFNLKSYIRESKLKRK